MSEVKRYDPFGYDGLSAMMHEDAHGDWVRGEDYDAMAGELDRVSRELSCLQSVIAEPDELNAEPASDYETLRRQYLSLRLLTNSALARNRYLCRRDDRDMRAALSVNAANVSAERDTNAMLTDLLEKAEAERDALHAEAEALRVALLEIASVNPAERGIEWAKSYASDGLKGAGSELYARWLETFKEAEALRAAVDLRDQALRAADQVTNAEISRLRTELEAARGLLEQRIPCDVMLPPATRIKRGCQLSTVLASMRLREDVAPNQRVFTATTVPEAPDHFAEASKMV